MSAPNVETPGRGDGAGVGEAVKVGTLKADGATLGGLRTYEAEKRRLLEFDLTPEEYEAQCRQIADLAGI